MADGISSQGGMAARCELAPGLFAHKTTDPKRGVCDDCGTDMRLEPAEPCRPRAQPWFGSRFFKRLSDAELVAWRPADGAFHEGNFAACNKEIERRAARAGLTPREWCTEKRQP